MADSIRKKVYVVTDRKDRDVRVQKSREELEIYAIIVLDEYDLWDFYIPNWIYSRSKECFQEFFDLCDKDWFLGDSSHYLGYTWIRDVPQKSGFSLGNFLSCLDTDYVLEDYPLKNKPLKKSPTDPTTTPGGPKSPSPKPGNSRKKTWRDQPDWKKRSGGDYD